MSVNSQWDLNICTSGTTWSLPQDVKLAMAVPAFSMILRETVIF